MNRRQFLASRARPRCSLRNRIASTPSSAAPPSASQPVRMKLGDQTAPTNETHLKYLARYGVASICGYPEIEGDRLYATVDELKRMKDLAAKYGISVDCIAPPFLASSSHRQRKASRHHAGAKPGARPRHRAVADHDQELRAGRHSLHQVQHEHSGRAAHRAHAGPRRRACTTTGSSRKRIPKRRSRKAGVVNADAFWERITYFLDRVIPVANEYKIRMACHPQDPGVPPEGYQGVNRVLGTIDGLKKFVTIQESPYHGLNFCQGTVSEDLAESERGDLRRHPLLRHAQEDLQRALPQHSRPSQRL